MACVPLIVGGAVIQGGGFYLALHHAAATRRGEALDPKSLPERGWRLLLDRTNRLLVRLGLRQPKPVQIRVSGAAARGLAEALTCGFAERGCRPISG